jgi:hypothetical protein
MPSVQVPGIYPRQEVINTRWERLVLKVREVLILLILLEVNADSGWDGNICHHPGPIGRRGLCMKESPFLLGGKKKSGSPIYCTKP